MCDHKKDIGSDEKPGQQNILVPTLCRGCEHEWENGGSILEKRDRADKDERADTSGIGNGKTETCATEGKTCVFWGLCPARYLPTDSPKFW